jgi:CTP:molybdopterin cytidylyltransferase MocA
VTVAACILSATSAGALRDVDGRALVRRSVEVAWAGGAVPIVVVVADPDGRVGQALAGAPVTLAEPAPPEHGPVGQIVRGIAVAQAEVAETEACLIWPARFAWVDAETLTSLIEAFGVDPGHVLRPAFRGTAGWPVLVPAGQVAALTGLGADRMPDELLGDLAAAGVPIRVVEVGDPGVVWDIDTARAEMPDFEGPPEPAGGHVHEWGDPGAMEPDEAPLEGPALSPYEPAGS